MFLFFFYNLFMISKAKISRSEIRELLTFFVDDYTSTKTANLLSINRNTANKYYKLFRNISFMLMLDNIYNTNTEINYVGCTSIDYGSHCCYNVYKAKQKIWLLRLLNKGFTEKNSIISDKDFFDFLNFTELRLSKFYGLSRQNIYLHYFESLLRYNFSKDEIFNFIWSRLNVKQPNKKKYT